MTSAKLFLTPFFFMFILAANIKGQQPGNIGQVLDRKQQTIVSISAFTAKGDLLQLQKAVNDGLDAGLNINEIKEILVQLYAYAGFPRSLNAITTLQAVVDSRKQKGINDILGKEPSSRLSTTSKFQFGKDVQTKLTGTTAIGSPQRFVPIIDTFLKEHLFADIFGRDVLDFKTREIATISALASLGGAESQLRSHFNVGMNTGLTVEQLKAIVSVLQTKLGTKEGNSANEVLQAVLNKSNSPTQPTQTPDAGAEASNSILPRGTVITNDNFTGTAWLHMLINSDSTFNTSIGNVTFEPGARTRWHNHPGGQILIVTNGEGRYGEKGRPVITIRKGDVIRCMPNVTHWHGAAPDSELTHIAIGTNPKDGAVKWLEVVSDQEYNSISR